MRPSLLLPCLLLPSLLPAQTQNIAWYKDNSPTAGGGNAFPFGSEGIRYQSIIPGSYLKNRPALINDIFVAGRGSNKEIVYNDIEIRMGVTTQALPTTNWKTNNPSPKLVYRGPMRVRFVAGKWLGIGLPSPYLWIPKSMNDNLCFEVIVWKVTKSSLAPNFYYPLCGTSSSPGGAIPRAFLYRWTSSQASPPATGLSSGCKIGLLLFNGNFVVAGKGCKGTGGVPEIGSSTYPQAGKPIQVTLTAAKPTSVALLIIGASFAKLGPIPLPFDMTPLGAPGCKLWNDLLLVLPVPVNASGKAGFTLPIPLTTGSARLYMHWWNQDPTANTFGFTTSSYGKMILGN